MKPAEKTRVWRKNGRRDRDFLDRRSIKRQRPRFTRARQHPTPQPLPQWEMSS